MRRLMSMFLLAAVLGVIPAGASTFLAMSQDELVRDSEAVVQGKVIQINSFWDPSGSLIWTEAMIQLDEIILGKAASVVVVRTPGGTVGGFAVEAHGFPQFSLNEKVLLFLEPEIEGTHRVAGHQQGQFRLVRDKSGVEIAVPTADFGAHLLTKDGRPAARPRAIRLDDLKSQIRSTAVRIGHLTD